MFLPLLASIPILFSLLPFSQYLLGYPQPTSYLFLLQNDKEIRTHGGFPGSYAKITITNDTSKKFIFATPQIDISFHDIYVPNGQITGHIEPPLPIQQAFKHGTLYLANAGWDPDFATASNNFRWFFTKGGEISPDIFGTITFSTINQLLNIIGPINLPDGQTLDTNSLYFYLQNQSEVGFFPGSTQKKDAISLVGKALITKAKQLPLKDKIRLGLLIIKELNNQNILLNSKNPQFQSTLNKFHWDGSFSPPSSYDYYSLVESNLGANKANNFITRNTSHILVSTPSAVTHYISLDLTNSSPLPNPTPPNYYGGNYIAYLRFYIPPQAANITLSRTGNKPHEFPQTTIQKLHGFTELGFFHITTASSSSNIQISYSLPPTSNYSLTILKQHGLPYSPQTVNLFGQTQNTPLEKDFFTSSGI